MKKEGTHKKTNEDLEIDFVKKNKKEFVQAIFKQQDRSILSRQIIMRPKSTNIIK